METVLGIDVGGTYTKIGFVNREGHCLKEASLPTEAQMPAEDLFSRVFEKAAVILKENENIQLTGIGIGAPNANYYKGTVEMPPNLNWGTVNVIDIVSRYYDLPSAITNDANAAALGELQFGAAKGMKDFIVVTLGTGLGSGIVSGGRLIYGSDGFAGELGHTIAVQGGRQCGCGRRGCLETYASASGIKRTAFDLMAFSTKQSPLRDIPFNTLTSKDIYDAAMKGDSLSLEAFDFTARLLGRSLADAVTYTSPEAIVLFGGLAKAGDLIIKPVKKYMEENMLNIFKNKVKVIPSGLNKGNTAVLGAAALIWNEFEKLNEHQFDNNLNFAGL